MRNDIGSHFEYDFNIGKEKRRNVSWLPSFSDSHFTISGRSAIELVIKDIEMERELKKVYMPSYCCKSMILPFIKNDVDVIFYDVLFDVDKGIHYNIDVNVDCDIFFAISYFGIEEFQQDQELKIFRDKGTIILEDITHRLLNDNVSSAYADYTIASLRKWFPIATGGLAGKHRDRFHLVPDIESDTLVENKINAMKQKSDFIKGKDIDKGLFLNKMAEFEMEFSKRDYRYKIDNVSLDIINNIDIISVKQHRRNNANTLLKGISGLSGINMLIPSKTMDNMVPLFLPIILEDSMRDNLRKYLIQHQIYCPIHWPDTELNSSSISNKELSLVCDQRYSIKDMHHILQIISEWHEHRYH